MSHSSYKLYMWMPCLYQTVCSTVESLYLLPVILFWKTTAKRYLVLWHCWLGDSKGIRPVKKLGVGLLVVMIWLELCTTYSSSCRPGSVQSLRPGVQMSAQDGSWIPVDLLPTRLRHFWSSPSAIGWPWSSQLPTCETCFVRRTSICIRRPFKLELTSCSH